MPNLSAFAGRPVVDVATSAAPLSNPAGIAYRLRVESYEPEQPLTDLLDRLLRDPLAAQVQALVIGSWEECYDSPSTAIVAALVARAPRLPGLRHLFLGDIDQEEAEISWIQQCDVAPLLEAFPALETFGVRGSTGLSFGAPLLHEALRSLTVECGGLSAQTLAQLLALRLPNLESLELWLGDESYGWDGTVDDLAPLLSGKLYPKLRRLGLKDSCIQDAVAQAVSTAPILAQLTELDLSMGTLSDAGAAALLASPEVRNLGRLDLRHHYMSDATVARLGALGIALDTSGGQPGVREDDRYVEVGE